MRRNLFWLSDKQWTTIEPFLPTDGCGKERVDDRLPLVRLSPEYGPPPTIYNRLVHWAKHVVWETLFRELVDRGKLTATQMIDSTYIKAHRSA
jgi:transposase